MTTISAVQGVLPPHRYPQAQLTDLFVRLCLPDSASRAVVDRFHANTRVATRHLALPIEEYTELDGFTAANDAFLSVAVDLGCEAVLGALAAAGLKPADVDVVMSTTVTGIAVPSLDARIAARIGMRPDVKRIPMSGLGCLAGAAGVARLHDILLGAPSSVAVLVSVELCSLTLQRQDLSTANMIASGLFGDGAAAVVAVGADHPRGSTGPRVVDTASHLYPDSERAMGWDVGSTGLKIVLGSEVPDLVRAHLADDVQNLLSPHGLVVDDVSRWICHPGGPKVIETIQSVLGLGHDDLAMTWNSLNRIGNLSSASVLHVLADTLAERPAEAGDWGVLMAMGPGFCAELLLLRWLARCGRRPGSCQPGRDIPHVVFPSNHLEAIVIREGAYSYAKGDEVEPYTGKYAVKSADVFERIEAQWKSVGNDFKYYNPLRMEVELTTKCNDTCPSCGMGALPLREGKSIDSETIDRMVADFASVGIPSLSITGGEPFVATHGTLRLVRMAHRHSVDVSKITTNGLWGSERRCDRTFDSLEKAGLFDNELFVPLIMLSVGEQSVSLEYVARILHRAVSRYTNRELTVAVSSLADPDVREHRIYELIDVYERTFGDFPHDRVHSTMRVYLNNDRLLGQKQTRRPGATSVSRWMKSCFACFTPSVGTYILPTGLVKQDGKFYTCGAFNVPEKLAFGNVFQDGIKRVLERVNESVFVQRVRGGEGLRGLHSVIPKKRTDSLYAPSYCDSCTLLIDEHDSRTGERTGFTSDVVVPVESLFRATGGPR